MLSVPCFAAENSLSTVQNFVFNRDSGIVPTASFSGVSGMDDKTYVLTANIKGWQSDSLYQWSNFSSPSSYFAFKIFNSSIYIPVNIPVPLSESNVVYEDLSYTVYNDYYVYSNLGIGSKLDIDYSPFICGFLAVLCGVLAFKAIFGGVLLRRKKRV